MSNSVDNLIEYTNITRELSNLSLSDSEIPVGHQLPRTPINISTQELNVDDQTEAESLSTVEKSNTKKFLKSVSKIIFRKTRSNPLYVPVEGLEKDPPRRQWARYQNKFENFPSVRERLVNLRKRRGIETVQSDSENGTPDKKSSASEKCRFQKRPRSASVGSTELRCDRAFSREIDVFEEYFDEDRYEKRRQYEEDNRNDRKRSFDGERTSSRTSSFSPVSDEFISYGKWSPIEGKYQDRACSAPDICEAVKTSDRELCQSHQMCDDDYDKKDVLCVQTKDSDSCERESLCGSRTLSENEGRIKYEIEQIDNSPIKKTKIFTSYLPVNFSYRCGIHSKFSRKSKSYSSLWEHNFISRGTPGSIHKNLLFHLSSSETNNRHHKGKTSITKLVTRSARVYGNSAPYRKIVKSQTNNTQIKQTHSPTAKIIVKSPIHPTSSGSTTVPPISAGNAPSSTPTRKTSNPTTPNSVVTPTSGATYQPIPTTSGISNSFRLSNFTQSVSQSGFTTAIRNSQNPSAHSNSVNPPIITMNQAQSQALASNLTDLHKGQRALTLLLQIPAFSGSPSIRFDRWIKQFENVVNMSNWTDDEKVNMLTTKMTDKAYDILQNILESHTTDYNDIKNLLQDRFHGNETIDYYEKKFDKCERKPLESVLDFAFRLKTVFNRAYPPRPNETAHETAAKLKFLRQKFLQGLDSNLRNKIKYKTLATFEDLVKEAQKYAIRLDEDKEEKDKREFINAVSSPNAQINIPEIKTIISETVNAVTSSFKPNHQFNKPAYGDGKANQSSYSNNNTNSYRGRGNGFVHQGSRSNFSRPQLFQTPTNNSYQSNSFRPQVHNAYRPAFSNFRPPFRPSFNQQNFRNQTIYCGYCGYAGHTRENCNKLRRLQSQPAKIPPTCVNCNESGHYALVCPRSANETAVSSHQPSAGNA